MGLFSVILIFGFVVMAFSIQISELDYFVYYIPAENVVVCSEIRDFNKSIILNEFRNEKGFTCL